MNEQLIKFIELCLMDGVVTEKELFDLNLLQVNYLINFHKVS